MIMRGHEHAGLERALHSIQTQDALGHLDREIAALERERASLVDSERKRTSGGSSGGGRSADTRGQSPDRDDDWTPSR